MKFILCFLLSCLCLYGQATKIHERKKAEIEQFLNKAAEHLSYGESEVALEYIEDALFVNTLSVEAYSYRADYYMQIGLYTNAIKDLEYVVKYAKDPMYSYVRMGICYLKMRSLDSALNVFTKAMSIKQDSDIYYYIGLVYEAKNEPNKAMESYSSSIKLQNSNAKSYYSRGVLSLNMGQYMFAVADFEKAISIGTYKNPYQLFIKCGESYTKMGNYDLAIEYYDAAIEMNPKFSEAYFSRGQLYYDLKYYNDAIIDFSKAISINPYFSDAYKARGNAYLANGEPDKGMKDFDYIKKAKNNTYVY